MYAFLRSVILAATGAALVVVLSFNAIAQVSKKEPAGSVSGRVMLGGNPLARVSVVLTPSQMGPMQRSPAIKGTTDEEGHYRITGLPAGIYTVWPFVPALVIPPETSSNQPGKSITLREDEEVDGIDFSLTRGGVITGRVTDADGRPIIDNFVNLIRLDERGQRMADPYFSQFRFATDDRGIYRIYGLAPGRYKVSVGDAPDSGMTRYGFGGGTYPRTFHPDIAEESRAPAIEVKAGGETADIDIRLGRASKSYVATGRIVDAETGKPLANLQIGHGSISRDQTNLGGFGWTGIRSTANGEFRIDALAPGRYAAFVIAVDQVDFYSEPAVFEVSDSDVRGLEIKVRQGSSIIGQAAIEGASDPSTLLQISNLELRAFVRTEQLSAPTISPIRINPDGSFVITGLRPGKVRIMLGGGFPPPKGFTLLRVEREGVELRDGIDISAGERLSGVRVVIGYGTGVIRGDVKLQNGQLAPDARLRVTARRLDSQGPTTESTGVDVRGRFNFEGLVAGEYELVLHVMRVMPPSVPGGPPPPGIVPPKALAKQNITISNGNETEVTLVVDLGAKEKEDK